MRTWVVILWVALDTAAEEEPLSAHVRQIGLSQGPPARHLEGLGLTE